MLPSYRRAQGTRDKGARPSHTIWFRQLQDSYSVILWGRRRLLMIRGMKAARLILCCCLVFSGALGQTEDQRSANKRAVPTTRAETRRSVGSLRDGPTVGADHSDGCIFHVAVCRDRKDRRRSAHSPRYLPTSAYKGSRGTVHRIPVSNEQRCSARPLPYCRDYVALFSWSPSDLFASACPRDRKRDFLPRSGRVLSSARRAGVGDQNRPQQGLCRPGSY